VTQRHASDIFAGIVPDEMEQRIAAVTGVKGVAGELAMFAPVEKDHQLLGAGLDRKTATSGSESRCAKVMHPPGASVMQWCWARAPRKR